MVRPWNLNTLASIYELESDEARRVLAMEGARGVAVALVFLVHYIGAFAVWGDTHRLTTVVSQSIWTLGHSGVDLFFVLSGYLIYGAAIKPSLRYGHFMKRRIQRIYPTFLVVFAAYLALSFVFPSRSKLPEEPAAAAIYVVQNLLLLPGLFPIQPMISVAWSLSYEFFFYLTLPVLTLVLGLHRWQLRARVAFWLTVSLLFIASWFIFTPQASRMLMFIAGILVYEGIHSSTRQRPMAAWKEWAALALVLAAFAAFLSFERKLPNGDLVRTLISAVVFGTFVFVLFRAKGPLRSAFSWTPLRWLGNMSYSYYLIHALVINTVGMVLFKVVPAQAPLGALFWVAMPFVFLATFVVSTLLFALVEKPFSLVTARKYPLPPAEETVAP